MKALLVYEDGSKEYTAIHKSFHEGLKEDFEVVLHEFRQISDFRLFNRVFNRIPFCKMNYDLLQNRSFISRVKTEMPDIVFIIKGNPIFRKSLKKIREDLHGIKIFNFNPDDPFNPRVTSAHARSSFDLIDCYFIWSKKLIPKLLQAGVKDCSYFPFAVDPLLIYEFPEDCAYKYPVSFIGNADKERVEFVDELIQHTDPGILHLFGDGWNAFADRVHIHPQKRGLDYLRTIKESKIVLNALRNQNRDSINMKTFEIPAAKGFMVHEWSSQAMNYFISDKEAVFYKDVKELADIISYYLRHTEIREQIKSDGHKKASSECYTYRSQCATVTKKAYMIENSPKLQEINVDNFENESPE